VRRLSRSRFRADLQFLDGVLVVDGAVQLLNGFHQTLQLGSFLLHRGVNLLLDQRLHLWTHTHTQGSSDDSCSPVPCDHAQTFNEIVAAYFRLGEFDLGGGGGLRGLRLQLLRSACRQTQNVKVPSQE